MKKTCKDENMKKTVKIALIAICSVTALALIIGAAFVISLKIAINKNCFSIDNIEEYYKVCEKDGTMPQVSTDEFEPYSNIEFYYEQNLWVIISERWYKLVMSYDEGEYQKQVNRIEYEYTFISTIPNSDSYEKTFEYGNYTFKVCTPYVYPKEMSFIGFDETNHKICYIFFSDYELDYTDDFPEFFKEHQFTEKGGFKK